MDDYVSLTCGDDVLRVWFYNENDKPFALGKKMNAICDEAYMNGYNWDAFFNYYLASRAPEVLSAMQDSDPEAGSYVAYFNKEYEAQAARFVAIIRELVENEDETLRIVREECDCIAWD